MLRQGCVVTVGRSRQMRGGGARIEERGKDLKIWNRNDQPLKMRVGLTTVEKVDLGSEKNPRDWTTIEVHAGEAVV